MAKSQTNNQDSNKSQKKEKQEKKEKQKQNKENKNISDLKEKIDELEELTKKYLNGWKRARADYQNREKEIRKEKKEWMKFSNSQLIKELLYILDSFNHSLDQVPDDLADNDWVKGIVQISSQFEQFLKGQGVEKIKTIGQEFDPNLHEAVDSSNEELSKSNKIKKEVQAGYTMHDKVLRPAKVIIE